jgi:glucose-6-phosphate 1-dehydrogenase
MTDTKAAEPPPPCTLVIFGVTGDLTKRLLLPALRNLRRDGLLADDFQLVGIASRDIGDEGLRKHLRKAMAEFKAGNADDDVDKFEDAATYAALAKRIKGNALFYLATPPNEFSVIIEQLGKAGLVKETADAWRRVIIEKPFGHDLASAIALNKEILGVLQESQIFRIDHYLGKQTVQNIMVFRFANGFVEPLWSRDHIDHVQITVAETVGVEQRGKFYDKTGALRDMVPNHIFQLVSLIAMEPPARFDAEALRSEKAKVLDSVQRFTPYSARGSVVRAQYAEGTVGDKQVAAYKDSPDVPKDSRTETYVAMKLMIDNWRWAGVPFYVRTGKSLATRKTDINIRFKQAPLTLFRDTPVDTLPPNDLTIRIQPDEGVSLRFGVKVPEPQMRIEGVDLKFNYSDSFNVAPSTGYETLIYDCMIGDATLFQRADNIEAGWRIVQPILDVWAADKTSPMPSYKAGSSGPDEADSLLRRDGRSWRSLVPRAKP